MPKWADRCDGHSGFLGFAGKPWQLHLLSPIENRPPRQARGTRSDLGSDFVSRLLPSDLICRTMYMMRLIGNFNVRICFRVRTSTNDFMTSHNLTAAFSSIAVPALQYIYVALASFDGFGTPASSHLALIVVKSISVIGLVF